MNRSRRLLTGILTVAAAAGPLTALASDAVWRAPRPLILQTPARHSQQQPASAVSSHSPRESRPSLWRIKTERLRLLRAELELARQRLEALDGLLDSYTVLRFSSGLEYFTSRTRIARDTTRLQINRLKTEIQHVSRAR